MPDGSLYTAEHEISLQMEGLNKPRRKRGRPPKVHTDMESKVCNKRVMYFDIFIYFYFVQTLYIF